MPAWNDYKKEAKARGCLAYELYIVDTVVASSPELVKATLMEHLAYQREMEIQGKLAFAGPVSDESGELMQGNGLVIYKASSLDEAREIAENDPMHQSGARTYTLRRWLINEGSISLNVGLSTGHISLS